MQNTKRLDNHICFVKKNIQKFLNKTRFYGLLCNSNIFIVEKTSKINCIIFVFFQKISSPPLYILLNISNKFKCVPAISSIYIGLKILSFMFPTILTQSPL
ncbi:hypothetical protein EDEG_04067 [Edhazardia aedis USNM 41457]|uniref:Uncharacterized protein n=1 Tax=Edhazardia aedis (strain USNM 41457) TaxID=1003232 RepID=J9D003_EDHAE|nr:hypothetical protein EDEG_04067 [Edhazardia aedis USNM 41457]|eukprot:EJW01191.1 hypothetical protein EDEG_04067 [Edhazardia aedis USNM 41457]